MQPGDGGEMLLKVEHIKKYFPLRKNLFEKSGKVLKAVDDISLTLNKGEVLGLVGESGCGKTTLGRLIMRAYEPTEGEVFLNIDGSMVNLTRLKADELRNVRRHFQMVFQDPYSSLDPRKTVMDIVGEPMKVNGIAYGRELEERVAYYMDIVGLDSRHMHRYPHAFSGGQRQRIGIARALATNPRLVICDEAVSALDVSVQAQILNLLMDLQESMGLTYVFISHGLSAVRHISTQVAVMYVGHLVEQGPADELYEQPLHPYTEALLSAAPDADLDVKRKRIILPGEVANPVNTPPGCPFHPRCMYCQAVCRQAVPAMEEITPGHFCACHRARELALSGVKELIKNKEERS